MNLGEQAFEQAEQNERAARDRAVSSIRAQLSVAGSADCADCGDEIEAARRIALPSARRCVTCQAMAERKRKEV